MPKPAGGIQTSLVGAINTMASIFRRQSPAGNSRGDPSQGQRRPEKQC
jgi:hypothetical protein